MGGRPGSHTVTCTCCKLEREGGLLTGFRGRFLSAEVSRGVVVGTPKSVCVCVCVCVEGRGGEGEKVYHGMNVFSCVCFVCSVYGCYDAKQ